MQNVTFSAAKKLLERARQVARERTTTLNQLFRDWLAEIVKQPFATSNYDRLMERLRRVRSGRRFTRDELNER